MLGDAEDVDVPGGHFDHEQDVQAAQEDRVYGEEVAGQKPVCLCAEEGSPGGVLPAGRWPAGSAEDPADGRCAEVVTEPGEFAVHAAVSPGGVLPGQSQDQVADFVAGLRAAGRARAGPFALDEATVPGQQSGGGGAARPAGGGPARPGPPGRPSPAGDG